LRSNISAWFATIEEVPGFSERRRRLLKLAKGRKVVTATPANVFYLTDFFGSGVGIVEPDRTIVVTSALESGRAGELGQEVEVVEVGRWAEVAVKVASMVKGEGVLVDDDSMFRTTKGFSMEPGVFLEVRRRKDGEELRRIEEVSKILDSCFALIEREMKKGMTEWQVAAELVAHAMRRGATMSASDSSMGPIIVAGGPNGALPHSELTNRKLREGDMVVADIFFRYEGYNSDSTRTFAIGRAAPEARKSYATVREAQRKALEAMEAGRVAGDVNEAAVAVLRKSGLDRYLNHSVGHGVGIDIHESPGIYAGNKVKLAKGDVATDEPGVYFAGKYGIRIEDTVSIEGGGARVLTNYTKDLVTLG
jgi:Xaa-Pro aminopeptidase